MPKALIPLTASHVSVSRRVAVSVVEFLSTMMGLPNTTKIFLPGQTQAVPMDNGEFGNCCSTELNYPGDSRIILRFTEEAEEDHSLTTSVLDGQERPIFQVSDLMVELRTISRVVKMNCSIEFISASSTQAQRWLDDMRAMFSAGRMENLLELEYYYQMPEGANQVLKAIHDTIMKSNWPITQTFEEWVIGNLSKHVYPKNLTTLGGFHDTLAIAEKQQDVLGWFDWTNTPDTPERNDDGSGTFTVSMNYQLNYARPTHVHANYPMIVHQKAIPKIFRMEEPYGHLLRGARKVSSNKEAFDEFRFLENNIGLVEYAHYPNTDDWYPQQQRSNIRGLIPLFTGLVMLGGNDQQTLMDLSNLGNCKFTPHFLEYFYAQGDRVLSSLHSFINIHLYRNEELLTGVEFEFVPGTLKVRTKSPLDPKYVYHVQILIRRNWMMVSGNYRECIRNWPTVAWTLARVIGIYLGGAKTPAELKLMVANAPRANVAPCYGEGYLLPEDQPPGVNWGVKPTDVFIKNGVIRYKDVEQVTSDSDLITDHIINHVTVGPVTVMYAEILTFRKE